MKSTRQNQWNVPKGGLFVALISAMTGCENEQAFTEIKFERIAIATGDFDRAEEFLTRNEIASTPFEGFIVQSVYDEETDPDSITLKTETLFTGTDDDGDPEINGFQAVFVDSGTRGFGEYVYNGVEEDDDLLTNSLTAKHVEGFLDNGGTLVVSDWGYDLIELVWPDAITFLNEDEGVDAAQVGASSSIIADVVDEELALALDNDQLEVSFDFTYWTVMESVSPNVDVYLTGSGEARVDDGEGYTDVDNIPLLVGFDAGGGRVIFSTFAWKAQNPSVTDAILLHLIEGLDPGGSNSEDTGSD